MRRWVVGVVAVVGALVAVSHVSEPAAAARSSQSRATKSAKPAADEWPQVGEAVARYLRVRLRRAATPVAPGARATLVAEVVPAPKMHVYAPGQREYLSVELTLPASPDYKSAPPVFPPAKSLYLEPIRATVQVFDAPFRITQDVTLAQTPAVQRLAASGEPLIVTGTLKYQACDDLVCYRPDTASLSWPIPVGRAKDAVHSRR